MTDSEQVQELGDKETIRQLFVDYARYIDRMDYRSFANLFARDGVLVAMLGEAKGAAAIEGLMGRYKAEKEKVGAPVNFHVVANPHIEIDGDTAKAELLWLFVTPNVDGEPIILQSGWYQDDLVREDGAWKIARHDIRRVMGRSPLHEPQPSRLDVLARRVQELEDREEIRLLMVRAQDSQDQRDLVGYGNCFTEDGVWAAVTGRAVGPTGIAEFLATVLKPWRSEAERSYHIHVNSVITVDGDSATSHQRWAHIFPDANSEGWVRHVGHHDDTFERTPDGWRIKQRLSYSDIPYVPPKHQLVGNAQDGSIG